MKPSNELIKVSLILPIYNVEAYLQECFESILAQTFEHKFEALLINDCSTDNSLEICQGYVKSHSEIFKLFNNTSNQGVHFTRNRGLDKIRGDYFMFVDSDDLLPNNAVQDLYQAIENSNASLVKGNAIIFKQDSEQHANYNIKTETLIQKKKMLSTYFDHELVRGHPWGKLFSRELLGHIRFPTGNRMAEDLFYCAQIFSEADSALLINKTTYHYRKLETGLTGQKYFSTGYLDWLDTVEDIKQYASTESEFKSHRGLMLRTLTQMTRECRKLPLELKKVVFDEICRRRNSWKINFCFLFITTRLPLRSLFRYFKFKRAFNQIKSQLNKTTI